MAGPMHLLGLRLALRAVALCSQPGNGMSKKKTETACLKSQLSALEALVERMETGELSLEESLSAFRTRHYADPQLPAGTAGRGQKVEILTAGTPHAPTEPFDDDADPLSRSFSAIAGFASSARSTNGCRPTARNRSGCTARCAMPRWATASARPALVYAAEPGAGGQAECLDAAAAAVEPDPRLFAGPTTFRQWTTTTCGAATLPLGVRRGHRDRPPAMPCRPWLFACFAKTTECASTARPSAHDRGTGARERLARMAGGRHWTWKQQAARSISHSWKTLHPQDRGLILASVRLGSLAAGASKRRAQSGLERYAKCIGLAFQVP